MGNFVSSVLARLSAPDASHAERSAALAVVWNTLQFRSLPGFSLGTHEDPLLGSSLALSLVSGRREPL